MKKVRILAVVVCVMAMVLAISSVTQAQTVVFFDNFDDGNINGWLVGSPRGAGTPDIVPSPEGYSLRGKYSGYGDSYTDIMIWPIVINSMEISMEMRAKSGSSWPNGSALELYSGSEYSSSSYYEGLVHGEGFRQAQFTRYDVPPSSNAYFDFYDIGDEAYEWHDYRWTRNSEGWWSLYVDNQLEWQNFRQDTSITSFNGIALNVYRDKSEIEWVKISVPEPVTLLLLGLGGMVLRRFGR